MHSLTVTGLLHRVSSSRSLASTASPAPSSTASVSPEALCFSRTSELSPPVPMGMVQTLRISGDGGGGAAHTPEEPDAARSPNEPMQSSSSPCRISAAEKESDSINTPLESDALSSSLYLSESPVLSSASLSEPAVLSSTSLSESIARFSSRSESAVALSSASDSVALSNLDTLARVSAMFHEIEKQNVQEMREAAKEAPMMAAAAAGKDGAMDAARTTTQEKPVLKLTISQQEWQQHLQLTKLQQQQPPNPSRSYSYSSSQPSSPQAASAHRAMPRSSSQSHLGSSSSQSHLGSKLPPTAARFNNSSYLSAEAFEEYFRQASSLAEVVQRISSDHPSQWNNTHAEGKEQRYSELTSYSQSPLSLCSPCVLSLLCSSLRSCVDLLSCSSQWSQVR